MNKLSSALPKFAFDNSFSRSLEGCFVEWNAATADAPKLLQLNHELAKELGLDPAILETDAGTSIFSGNVAPEGAAPMAQAYAGHQFGGFSPQLGDGRALLLGEVIDIYGRRRDLQLKGSGRTPFSRGGDGKSALGPVLREYLIGEAMHALGVPTTRALAAVSTGEMVRRETPLPGGILTRVAASHMRVGTFQFFAARGDEEKVRQLADYAIARHHPAAADAESPYLAFLEAVAEAQASLVAHWMSIGFIHGVMNTDNMTISGETIDYGPCAFMDSYAPDTVFSSIDTQGRYAYGNQPDILGWNLARLAETLIPLIDPDKDRAIETLTDVINTIPARYDAHWAGRMRRKIGLTTELSGDVGLIDDLLTTMHQGGADFTLTFRHLAAAVRGNAIPLQGQFTELSAINAWLETWRARLAEEDIDAETRADAMDRINPLYIPRNHKVEEALDAAVDLEDMGPFEALLEFVSHPFDPVDDQDNYAAPGPQTNLPYQTFCGT
ncbi:MAG: YdiU family protein [Alphaproteobacteria bacterium]|nr:YdiU family protein [Alphaproteobacteria bacterium]